MTNSIGTVEQANKQFSQALTRGRTAVAKSHVALVWALLNSLETQDLTQLTAMRASVAGEWPALVSRFTDYVCATLDGVECKSGEFIDNGDTFTESQCAVYAVVWNTKDKLAKDAKAPAACDPRVDIKRLANKLAKRGLSTGYSAKAKGQAAIVLAKALADMEAIHAGTYKAAAKAVKSTPVANVTPLRKSA